MAVVLSCLGCNHVLSDDMPGVIMISVGAAGPRSDFEDTRQLLAEG